MENDEEINIVFKNGFYVQAMAKAHRLDANPSTFVLVEDVYKEWRNPDTASAKKNIAEKLTSRVLEDEENVFEVQSQWKTPGRFSLREREEVGCTTFALATIALMLNLN